MAGSDSRQRYVLRTAQTRGFLRWTVGRWEAADKLPKPTFYKLFWELAEAWMARMRDDLPAELAAIRSLRRIENRVGVRVDLQASTPDHVFIREWSPRSQVGVWHIWPESWNGKAVRA